MIKVIMKWDEFKKNPTTFLVIHVFENSNFLIVNDETGEITRVPSYQCLFKEVVE